MRAVTSQKLMLEKEIGCVAPMRRSRELDPNQLKREFRSKLELPRIENRARSAHRAAGAGDAVAKVGWRGSDEIRCAVHGEHLVHVGAVEQVKRIKRKAQPLPLTQVEAATQAQVHGLQRVAAVGIARGGANAVSNRIAVIVCIEPNEQGKRA